MRKPSQAKWKKKYVGQPWYLGETIITGIGQGYIQFSSVMQNDDSSI